MRKNFCFSLVVVLIAFASFSCSEKEVEHEVSPNMLISVRDNFLLIELKDGTANKEKIELEAEKVLGEKKHFTKGNAYEMKLGTEHEINLYETLGDYYANKIKIAGEYDFDTEEMYVTFLFDGEVHRCKISGGFSNGFYCHFVRQEGGGKHHIYPERQVFSLEVDYTEELKEEFPDLKSAIIRTDMITTRALESVKVK